MGSAKRRETSKNLQLFPIFSSDFLPEEEKERKVAKRIAELTEVIIPKKNPENLSAWWPSCPHKPQVFWPQKNSTEEGTRANIRKEAMNKNGIIFLQCISLF